MNQWSMEDWDLRATYEQACLEAGAPISDVDFERYRLVVSRVVGEPTYYGPIDAFSRSLDLTIALHDELSPVLAKVLDSLKEFGAACDSVSKSLKP